MQLNMKASQKKKNRGFTIVELLVSMTLFLIVTTIAVGSFVRALRAQQAIVGLIAVNDNTSLTLEQMAREIRTGIDFSTQGEDALIFTNTFEEQVTYQVRNNRLERQSGTTAFIPLTASNIRVVDIGFYLMTTDAHGNAIAPRVTITMTVGSTKRDIKDITTTIQTTVSPRVIN
jgi:prepilin-type N-terminal cleavage/methylation domain-containing protein